MFKNLTYKKKNLLLLLATVLSVFIIYTLAIKKTILAYDTYQSAKQKTELAANAPFMAAKLEKELIQMDTKIGNQNKNEDDTEQALLELITNYCQNNSSVLREFPKTTTAEQEKLIVETNMFVIEGSFSDLLKLVYQLEQRTKLGKVTSTRYQLKKDISSKEMVLTVTIYIQNIKKRLT